MAKKSAGEFRNGMTLEIDGKVCQVVEFMHVKPGKGAAFVRTKLKNIISGGAVERTFRPTEKFPKAHIDRKDMQYLYQDGDLYNFMDVETYDQIALNEDVVGDSLKFVKENEEVTVTLTLDNDEELECVVLTIYEAGGREYIALLPIEEDEENEEGDVFIYRYTEVDGEPSLDNIEDDDEYEVAADAFDEWLDAQEFEDMDEE